MYLFILNGDHEGDCIELTPGTYTVGRAESNDIVLDADKYVSSSHAELTFAGDGALSLADRNSRNGTYLLGEPVTTPVAVHPGDIFRIGRTYFKLTRRKAIRFLAGGEGERSPEAIVVIDIVGSSKIAQMMGDSVAGKIKSFLNETITACLETRPPEYLKNTGDGYMIIFTKALPAVQFATDLLAKLTGDGGYKSFHIRIGINYGETATLPDGDRRGSAVDMAFRIESVKAHDMHQTMVGIRKDDLPRVDRIFISESIQKLIASHPTIATRCIGFFDLKGFNGRHKIFEVLT